MTVWSKTITYLPSTDISGPEKFVKLDPLRLVGTGDIRSATLVLNARRGAFITNSNSGATPILTAFDKIKISLTDKLGNTKSLVGIIDDEKPVRKAGPNVIVNLFGQERWLQKIHMPAMMMERISHYDAIRKIIDIYNENKGTSQVTIEKHDDITFNESPRWTAINIDFSDEPTLYDALMRVISRTNTTVANGGANEFYELYFEDDPADTAKIRIKVFISGSDPVSPITVQQSNTTRIYDISGQIQGKTGTVLVGKGADGFGTIPIEPVKFWSRLEQFQLHPAHIASLTYPSGAKVQKDGVHYKSNTSTSNTPPHADWDTITAADEIGLVRPSPYTYQKSSWWKNAGANPTGIAGGTGTGFDQEAMWDGNMTVRDEDHFRDWVHLKSTTDNFDVTYKYGSASGGVYRGLRCLVNGTGINGFSGNDKNGVAFTNSIVQYDGSDWVVIRSAQTDDVCCVRKEAKNYIFNGTTWADDSAEPRANDTFHIYDTIGNTTGVAATSKQKGDGTWLDLDGDTVQDTGETYGTDSAVEVTYKYTPFSGVLEEFYTNINYYSIGAWLNWEMAPIPANTNNSISEAVGEVYGGDSTKKEPATFDMAGTFGLTPTGNQGWNNDDADEQGPRDSIRFALRFIWEFTVLNELIPFQGNFKFRVIVYDTSGNTFFKDITILDNNRWEFFEIFADEMQVYTARAPLKWGNIETNIITPELEILEKFEWKNAKLMCIQWQESYDDVGRYSPETKRPMLVPLASIIGAIEVRAKLSIDVFNFGGQLVATTGKDTTLNIEPEFYQRPNTTNYEQLRQDMEAQKELEQHPYDAWTINGEAILDRDFGESIYVKDTALINSSDNGPNTKKVVVKEFNVSINGTDGGTGGFMSNTFAVKRI